ncbi:MAG: tetratricopeptide repeat protein [Fidelibacterota bacterium]
MNILQLKTIEQYLNNKPDSQLFVVLAQALMKDGQLKKAEEVCRQGLTHYSYVSEGYYLLAVILLKKGNLLEAIKHLQNTIKYCPGHINAHKLLLQLGKENLSLREIDDSHKVIENFENSISPIDDESLPHFSSDNFNVQQSDEEPFLDEQESYRQKEEIPDAITDLDLENEERNTQEFQSEDEVEESKDNTQDIPSESQESITQERAGIPEIDEIDIDEEQEEERKTPDEAINPDNKLSREPVEPDLNGDDFELDLKEDDDELDDSDNSLSASVPFELDLDEEADDLELDDTDLDEIDTDTKAFNDIDKAIDELHLDDDTDVETTDSSEKTKSSLSIQPVHENFDQRILREIEENKSHDEETVEEISEESEQIPEFKGTLKNTIDDPAQKESKEKVNLNIPIPTLTFVEVLKNQKLYDQALEILDLLEKRSSEKEKIIQKKEEIIRLKAQDTY